MPELKLESQLEKEFMGNSILGKEHSMGKGLEARELRRVQSDRCRERGENGEKSTDT